MMRCRRRKGRKMDRQLQRVRKRERGKRQGLGKSRRRAWKRRSRMVQLVVMMRAVVQGRTVMSLRRPTRTCQRRAVTGTKTSARVAASQTRRAVWQRRVTRRSQKREGHTRKVNRQGKSKRQKGRRQVMQKWRVLAKQKQRLRKGGRDHHKMEGQQQKTKRHWHSQLCLL
jgi:hypothetical protein